METPKKPTFDKTPNPEWYDITDIESAAIALKNQFHIYRELQMQFKIQNFKKKQEDLLVRELTSWVVMKTNFGG